jgi:thiol:disulfide interchange protein DsbC
MSRATLISCSLLAISLMAGPPLFAAQDEELEAVRAKIDSVFEQINPDNVSRSPVDGWYTVQKGPVIAYISADGRYLLQGDMIDLDTQVNLSEKTRNIARRDVMSALQDDQTIMFSPADVKYRVTVFTDIDCTFCRKLHGEIEGYLAEGIEVRYLLYPRNGPRSSSWKTSESVWCASNRNAALTAAKQDHKFKSHKCDSSMISRHYMLGQSIGLTGTPAIVFDDGTLVSGYLPPATLSSRLLSLEQAQAAAN